MNKRRIALWALMGLCALGVGLWGRNRIRHVPDPTRYDSYRAWGGGGEGHSDIASARPFIPASILGQQVSKADVEAYMAEVTSDDRSKQALKWHQEEVTFVLGAWRDGDEFRGFNSPPDTWQNLCGRKGVALVRDGVAITGYITELN
jgi:hypothetical protein